MKIIYYVGLFLSEKVQTGSYGLANFVDCFAEADTRQQAKEIAEAHFVKKFNVKVNGFRTAVSSHEYTFGETILKAPAKNLQQNIFDVQNLGYKTQWFKIPVVEFLLNRTRKVF